MIYISTENYRKTINLSAGCGGDGFVSFDKAAFKPTGKPNGGAGGNGGSVYFEFSSAISDLRAFKSNSSYSAGNGAHGSAKGQNGKKGEDLVLEVPTNTDVNLLLNNTRRFLGRISKGNSLLAVQGGTGGKGNRAFVSSKNRSPLLAEAGEVGEKVNVELDTEIVSDLSFVGLPNSGKSALLSRLSERGGFPKMPPSPRSLLLTSIKTPVKNYTLVELPSIACDNPSKTPDDRVLKHLFSTNLLIFVLRGQTLGDLEANYSLLKSKVANFSELLLSEVQHVAVSVDSPEEILRDNHFSVNLNAPASVAQLKDRLFAMANRGHQAQKAHSANSLPTLDLVKQQSSRPAIDITPDGKFNILHRRAIQLANGSDLNNLMALIQYRGKLEEFGIIAELEKAGLKSNSLIRVGNWEFEWS